jgi:hypothetical protein
LVWAKIIKAFDACKDEASVLDNNRKKIRGECGVGKKRIVAHIGV